MTWKKNDAPNNPIDDALRQFVAMTVDPDERRLAQMPPPTEACVAAVLDALIVAEKGRRHLERLLDAFADGPSPQRCQLADVEFDFDALARDGIHALRPTEFWVLALRPFCVNTARDFLIEVISYRDVTVHPSWIKAFESVGSKTFLEKSPNAPKMG